VFLKKGIDLSKPTVTSCQTGMTATSLALAAHLIGMNNVSVYYVNWYLIEKLIYTAKFKKFLINIRAHGLNFLREEQITSRNLINANSTL